MKKLFPVLLMIVFMTGCISTINRPFEAGADFAQKVGTHTEEAVQGGIDGVGGAVNKFFKPSTGYLLLLAVLEINTNMSSLIIDKTKEKVVGYQSHVAKKIEPGKFLYVIPPKITNGETYVFDEEMGRAIRNFLAIGKYGIPVTRFQDAEYIVVTNIDESLSKRYGTNYSEVNLSIVDKMDIPVYAASVRVESKSDRNFWYYPTKEARPVQQLTVKGLGKIMSEGLPEAHGNPLLLASSSENYLEKNGKEK
jgi:hypothetical protein